MSLCGRARLQHDPAAAAMELRGRRSSSAPAKRKSATHHKTAGEDSGGRRHKAAQAMGPGFLIGDRVLVDASRRGDWIEGVVKVEEQHHFHVRLEKDGSLVRVPRSLVARAPAPNFRRKPRLDTDVPKHLLQHHERDHVRRNIEEAKAEAGEGFSKGSRVPKVRCGWAGPEFRDKLPFWARDKYIPARYQGIQWNKEFEEYDVWDPKISKKLNKRTGNGYVARSRDYKPPTSLGGGLERPPPRNTSGNLNFGDKWMGKVPKYLDEGTHSSYNATGMKEDIKRRRREAKKEDASKEKAQRAKLDISTLIRTIDVKEDIKRRRREAKKVLEDASKEKK